MRRGMNLHMIGFGGKRAVRCKSGSRRLCLYLPENKLQLRFGVESRGRVCDRVKIKVDSCPMSRLFQSLVVVVFGSNAGTQGALSQGI